MQSECISRILGGAARAARAAAVRAAPPCRVPRGVHAAVDSGAPLNRPLDHTFLACWLLVSISENLQVISRLNEQLSQETSTSTTTSFGWQRSSRTRRQALIICRSPCIVHEHPRPSLAACIERATLSRPQYELGVVELPNLTLRCVGLSRCTSKSVSKTRLAVVASEVQVARAPDGTEAKWGLGKRKLYR